MNEEEEIVVELHSTHPSAVEATQNTLKMIGGDLVERDSKYYLRGSGYVKWAAVHQGYVKSIGAK